MEEKRKHSRWKIEGKKAVIKEYKEKEVPLIDLSTGGMRLLLREGVPVGSKIAGHFDVSPRLGSYFIDGKVIWTQERTNDNNYDVGVQFEKISTIS